MNRAETRQPCLTAAELEEFLAEVFPQIEGQLAVEEVGPMTARLRLKVAERHLRPGGTISGPAMFLLADCAFYVAVLAMVGREPLTVTTNLNINFLRKPEARDVTGVARILKLGRTLAVGDVDLVQDGRTVAHATCTYALPQKR
ncbi:MAG TPA: PaaI family thioesterase [Thermohalobaculum sp.]|nr:PaaI family thioesterase [Thermohalobaculum sp.]